MYPDCVINLAPTTRCTARHADNYNSTIYRDNTCYDTTGSLIIKIVDSCPWYGLDPSLLVSCSFNPAICSKV